MDHLSGKQGASGSADTGAESVDKDMLELLAGRAEELQLSEKQDASASADTGAESVEKTSIETLDEFDKEMLELLDRAEELQSAGVDWKNSPRTRKVVRLSEEECRRIMAITPWPPVIPAHLNRQSESLETLKAVHAEWARIREQYATLGYAEVILEVDVLGIESFVSQ